MTINTQDRTAGPFAGNDVATVFPFEFKVFQNSDLLVFLTVSAAAPAALVLDADYSVTLNVDQNANPGGSVILLAGALATGTTLDITSSVAATQPTELTNQGGFFPKVIENALDRLTIIFQQLGFQSAGSGLYSLKQVLRYQELQGGGPIPLLSERKDKLFGFNSQGDPVAVVPVSDSAQAVRTDLASSSGASLVGWRQAGAGAVNRTVNEKLREIFSVKDFGAKGDGSDATDAFSAAASEGASAVPASDVSTESIERANVVTVIVPAGDYVLSDIVDTGGRDVRWIFEDGTKVTGYQDFLPGIIYRSGNKVSAETYGTGDYATAFKIYANHTNKEQMAGVSGFQNPAAVASRYGRDSCGLDVEIVAPPLLASSSNCTFTASRVTLQTPLSESVVKRMRKGMILDTSEPVGQFKYSGFVVGWDVSGTWIDVSGWFQFGGGGIATTPPNGLSVYVSPITNAIGRITYATLNANSYANRAIGGETDIVNNKIAPVPYPLAGAFSAGDNSPDLIGRLISSFGTVGKGTTALKTEGDWIYGAYVRNADYGLWYNKTGGTALVAGRGAAKILAGHSSGGNEELYLSNNRLKFKAGANGVATASLIDFVTGGSDIDYDVRIQASSGNGSIGNGSLSFTCGDVRLLAGTTMFGGTLRPFTDNAYSVGTTIFRPTQLFAVSGTINTSDGREKTEPKEVEDAVLDAWGEVRIICYQWLHAIALKGAGAARIHYGVIAQQVRDVFAKRGIDATIYGFLCYDKWDAQYETVPAITIQHPPEYSSFVGSDGEPLVKRDAWIEVIEPEKTVVLAEAGDRWGIREGQCLWLEAAWQRRENRRVKAQIRRLENLAGLEPLPQ
ncbi:tail fiber domain-containing protein [Comamonas sp. C24C]